jgi:site-specific recombinase XerD
MTTQPLTLDTARQAFIRSLEGRNRSPKTLIAYNTDLVQLIAWLQSELNEHWIHQVEQADLSEYLSYLADQELSGVSRARKLAAIREYFRFLVQHGYLPHSPAQALETPKREKNSRTYLTPDEYNRMLALAGASPRDYAILQVFLQTGIRVSELCALTRDDVDLDAHILRVRVGKGMAAREIELEKKAIQAVRSYLKSREDSLDEILFLNRYGEPISERGVQKLITRYAKLAGIQRKVSCHVLRHTFGTLKAQKGVSPFQLKEWLGHARLDTTQIYVHLGRSNAKKVMEATSL